MNTYFKGYFYGLFAALIWGTWMTLTRYAGTTPLNVHDVTFIRFSVASVILLPLLFKNGFFIKKENMKNDYIKTFTISLSAGLVYVLTFNYGLIHLPTVYGVLTPATMPIVVMLISLKFISSTVIKTKQLLGYGMSIIGVVLLIFNVTKIEINFWYFCLFFAAISWAIYTVLIKYWNIKNIFHSTSLVVFWSMVFYLPFYLPNYGLEGILNTGIIDLIIQVIIQGLLISIVALVAYTYSIKELGSVRASFFPILMPIIGTIFAIPLLGEVPTLLEIIALSIISYGAWYSLK